MTRSSSRFLAAMAVVGAAVAASLVVGAGTGHASTTMTISITPLIANDSLVNGDPVPMVSYGGKIGFQVDVANTDSSNATHVQVAVSVPGAAFIPNDATDSSCAAAKGDTSTMICIPNGGTMTSGSTYSVKFRFKAPSSGTQVTATPTVTIAAKTQGSTGNNGTLTTTGTPATVQLSPDGSTNDTFLRAGESSGPTGGPQNFSTTLPGTLLGTPYGLELGIHNETTTNPICLTCLGVDTSLTIPTASNVLNSGNPFYDGTTLPPTFSPYGWTMSATAATSFKLTGVYHQEDGASTAVQIPACADLGGAPTVDKPVCYLTLTSKNKAGVQNLNATGLGLENGRVGFG